MRSRRLLPHHAMNVRHVPNLVLQSELLIRQQVRWSTPCDPAGASVPHHLNLFVSECIFLELS
jgi:hypothetical protein